MDFAPVRSCCGKRHNTVQCPDGLVRCALCFDRFKIEDLNVTDDGTPEDVCKPCAEAEREQVLLLMEDDSHPCEHDDCSTSVHFDDEPFCYKHSPESGSYSSIYSYKAAKKSFEDDMNDPLFPKF